MDLDHAGDADDSCKINKTNPAKKKRRTKAACSAKDEDESAENSVQTMKQETKDVESSAGRRSTRIKKMQLGEVSSPEDKEENAKTTEDVAKKRKTRAEREIPDNWNSLTLSELRLRSSMKNLFIQLAPVKEAKISEARKLAKVEPNSDDETAEEEDMQTDTFLKKMRPQVKTYGGPKVKNAIAPQEVSNPKVKSEVVQERDREGKKARSSSSYTKDLLAFWHDPVLIHKSSSPAGNMSENARRVLSFSKKDQIKSDTDQDNDVQKSSGAKGIMKSARSPGQKKMVRFSDPLR